MVRCAGQLNVFSLGVALQSHLYLEIVLSPESMSRQQRRPELQALSLASLKYCADLNCGKKTAEEAHRHRLYRIHA